MTVKKMVDKYKLTAQKKFNRETDRFELTGMIRIGIKESKITREEINEIKARKPEILAYFENEAAKREQAAEERQAKIDAIPGLKEIQAAIDDLYSWQVEFERSFEHKDYGGQDVRPRPKHDIKALKAKYPAAAAYLTAEDYALKANDELSSIGKRALEKIIDDYNNYAKAMEEMDRELKEFTDRHFWD